MNGASQKDVINSPDHPLKQRSAHKGTCSNSFLSYLFISRQLSSKKDRRSFIKATLIELVIYLVYLVLNSIIVFGMVSSNDYYYTKVFTDLFVDTTFNNETKINFRTSTSINDFWNFTETTMTYALFWEDWYDDDKIAIKVQPKDQGILYENKLIGQPRIRQIRVKSVQCEVAPVFRSLTKGRNCFPHYDKDKEETKAYSSVLTGTAAKYHSEAELGGTSYWGKVATYSGAGAFVLLNAKEAETINIIEELKKNLWITRATRVVLLEFTVYNPNIKMFCVVTLAWEFPATGGLVTSWSIRSARFLRYAGDWDMFIFGCEIAFIVFTVYYTLQEMLEMCYLGFEMYITDFWSFLDIALLTTSYFCIGSSVYRLSLVMESLRSFVDNNNKNKFTDFEFVSFWESNFHNSSAICLFLSWIKIFKFVRFNKTMSQLSTTLSRCTKDIGGFAIMFFIVFFAFSQLGYLLFGSQVENFSTFQEAVFTLIRLVLGDFDFREIEAANRILGPVYFLCYVFFVFFVLLNMFLAIINDTYSEVKAEIQSKRYEYHISDYLSELFSKRELPTEDAEEGKTQGAIAASDGILTQEELRSHLRSAAFTEDEVDLFIARYGLVKDHVLEEEETSKVITDLEGKDETMDETTENTTALHGRVVGVQEIEHIEDRITDMEVSLSTLLRKMDVLISKLNTTGGPKTKQL